MPKTLKRQAPDPDVVRLQKLLSFNGYFNRRIPEHGIFDTITFENVQMFQLQHLDKTGTPLSPDGVVGPKTWWALSHPSGQDQKSHIKTEAPIGLTPVRARLMDLILAEHAKPVFEVPDGANRSPDIDGYWGGTGVIGAPWCCAFVSWALQRILGVYPIQGRHHIGVQKMWQAASRLEMAAASPKPGDLFIQIMSGGKGHTGFVIGMPPSGDIVYTCEGNCGNRLKVGQRPLSSIHHFVDCIRDGQAEDFSRKTLEIDPPGGGGTR